MKKIIVPTDFSENAFTALKVANYLATQFGYNLLLVHCYTPFRSNFQSDEVNDADSKRLVEEIHEEFTNLKSTLNEQVSTPAPIETLARVGDLLDVLKELGKDSNNALIVMGTNGASGIKYHVLGSNTLDVAKAAPLPILIVPPGLRSFKLENVLFLSDYQAQDQQTIADLVSVFGDQKIRYKLAYIYNDSFQEESKAHMEERLQDWADRLKSDHYLEHLEPIIVDGTENTETITTVAGAHQSDVLALTVVKRNFWDNLLNKSLAKAAILQPQIPIFVGRAD